MKCKQAVETMIDQIIHLLDQIPVNDFNRSLDVYEDATLGKHFRHVYEFFDCLVDQCNCGELDYGKRKREQSIENSPLVARDHFVTLLDRITQLQEEQKIKVYTDFTDEDGSRHAVDTTVGREIMYAYDHAVHHLAIVRIGLASLSPTIEFDTTLGVAASTVQHQYKIAHGHA